MLSWQTSTAVQLSNPSAVDCVHVAFFWGGFFMQSKGKCKGKAERKQKLLRDQRHCWLFSPSAHSFESPLHRPMSAARSTTRMPFSSQRIVVLWSTRASMTNRMRRCPSTEHGHWASASASAVPQILIDSLLRPVPTITCIHASTPHIIPTP